MKRHYFLRERKRLYIYRLLGIFAITVFTLPVIIANATDSIDTTPATINEPEAIIYDLRDYNGIEAKQLDTILNVAKERGFEHWERLVTIAHCESHLDEYAIGINEGSLDLGFYQINDYFQNISRECVFDLECATNSAIDIYERWGSFDAWTCNSKI